MVDALRGGTIAAAGLDVFEREPAIDAGLTDLTTWCSPRTSARPPSTLAPSMVRCCSENIVAVLNGDPPLTPVNPDVLT